jgi:tetratricopeptide (TPR) repeat protein
MWDDVYVPITIDVPTREMVEKNIQDVISQQPKASDYYAAAVYYRQENINIEKAVEWIDKAIGMSDEAQFWQLRQQSLIYAANGNIKGAIKVAKKSLEAAKIAGNQDYVKMNKDSIEEWSN